MAKAFRKMYIRYRKATCYQKVAYLVKLCFIKFPMMNLGKVASLLHPELFIMAVRLMLACFVADVDADLQLSAAQKKQDCRFKLYAVSPSPIWREVAVHVSFFKIYLLNWGKRLEISKDSPNIPFKCM